MCLHIKSGPHVADKDMTVWKVITGNNLSQWFDFKYSPNRKYKTVKLDVLTYDGGRIEEGYHAYRFKLDKVVDGLYKAVEFTIPKGATYYLGTGGDIVSNRIVSGDLKPQ